MLILHKDYYRGPGKNSTRVVIVEIEIDLKCLEDKPAGLKNALKWGMRRRCQKRVSGLGKWVERDAISETENTIDRAVLASEGLKRVNKFNLENIAVETVIETSQRNLISLSVYSDNLSLYSRGDKLPLLASIHMNLKDIMLRERYEIKIYTL